MSVRVVVYLRWWTSWWWRIFPDCINSVGILSRNLDNHLLPTFQKVFVYFLHLPVPNTLPVLNRNQKDDGEERASTNCCATNGGGSLLWMLSKGGPAEPILVRTTDSWTGTLPAAETSSSLTSSCTRKNTARFLPVSVYAHFKSLLVSTVIPVCLYSSGRTEIFEFYLIFII